MRLLTTNHKSILSRPYLLVALEDTIDLVGVERGQRIDYMVIKKPDL